MSRLYQLVYADPPWQYTNKKTGGSMRSGAAQKYETMATKDICALKVPFAPQAVLFLWVTVPMLPDGLRVLGAWGFGYRTMLTWHKTGRLGTGFWFRGETEHLLLGVRGHVPTFRTRYRNHFSLPTEGHSVKPAFFRGLAHQAALHSFDAPPKLEMFARTETEGWDAHGLEVPNAIILQP